MNQQLRSDQLVVTISPNGAEVTSVKNHDGLEFMWQAGPLWPRHAPVLFPVVGKLKDNRFQFDGRAYELTQHGFARDQMFELVSGDESSCTWALKATENSRSIYPFDFEFNIIYTLKHDTLSCAYKVVNPGRQPLYFSVGAHPAFRCPLLEGESFKDYFIEFPQRNFMVTALSDGLRTSETRMLSLENKKLLLTGTLFNQDALVFEDGQIDWVRLGSSKNRHTITMDCQGWPYFGIWSKKGGQEFICLEPWHGVADHVDSNGHLEQKTGVKRLEPGGTFSCSYVTTFV